MRPRNKKLMFGLFLGIIVTLGLIQTEAFRRGVVSKGFSTQTLGYQVALENGCFRCHGEEGRGGVPNSGAKNIPGFQDFEFLMSIKSEDELDGWILDGAPQRLRETNDEIDSKRAIKMPAYRGQISEQDYSYLKTYYFHLSGIVFPKTPKAEEGFKVAKKHGCFACHGYGGVLDVPNPGSLTGYIPAWSGPDYPELVKNDDELAAWILEGRPERLAEHPVARFFLGRQVLQMPAYRETISGDDLEAIMAYIHWLRDSTAKGKLPDFNQGGSEFDFFEY